MKIIHCADIHLDSKMSANLTKEKARERKTELLTTFQNMVTYGAEQGVAAIIIAGDLFDTKNVSATARNVVKDLIQGHPKIAFYYLQGNHDEGSFTSGLSELPENLHLFGNNWTSYELSGTENTSGKGVAVTGVELTPENSGSIYNTLSLDVDQCNIVVLHGQESEYSARDKAEIIHLTALKNKGIDYPLPFVRWTEKRNFDTILQAISMGNLDVKSLITEEVELKDYNLIYGDMRKHGSIASIIKYPEDTVADSVINVNASTFSASAGQIGIIGAGNFTSATMIPALMKTKARIRYIASAQGLSAKILAKKSGALKATSDYKEILADKEVDLVMITTRHNLHASMVLESLQAGKSVFVEKPLCLTEQELQEITVAYEKVSGKGITLTVGFNRRFSPFAQKMKQLSGQGVKNIIATMNAGFIPSDVWVHDLEVGGGRIIGEACHFIDLCSYLSDSKVVSVCMNSMGITPAENTDNVSIILRYENGSNAVINYFANGSKAYSKERIEVYSQEKTLVLDNWRELRGYGFKGFSKMKSTMDKGHAAQFALLNERIIKGGEELISFDSILNTTKASFACIESLKQNSWIEVK